MTRGAIKEQGTPARPELGRMVDLYRIEHNWRPKTALQALTVQGQTAMAPCKRRIRTVSKLPYQVIERLPALPNQRQAHIRLADGTEFWAIYLVEE